MFATELASEASRTESASLSRIVDEIESAFRQGHLEVTASLIQRNLLGAWFGINPHRFAEILAELLRSRTPIGPVVQVLASLLFDGELEEESAHSMLDQPASTALTPTAGSDVLRNAGIETFGFDDLPAERMRAVYRMFKLRMVGKVTDALKSADEAKISNEQLKSVFDRDRAWSLFQSVQLGVTEMLAGDFHAALASFARARMHGIVPSLEFLSRDACVRAALIEALFGDEEKARILLKESDRVPRTTSWTEQELDTVYTTAAALVAVESVEDSRRMLESVPLQAIGEGWPFYLAGVHRALLGAGDHTETALRLSMYEQMPLPHVPGDGFSGSVLPLTAAQAAIARGDLNEARQQVLRADQNLLPTRLLVALLDVAAGDARAGLRAALVLREETQGLRLLEVWRIVVLASSHHLLGNEEACAGVLESAISAPFRLRPAEADLFPSQVQAFASARFAAWPGGSDCPAARAVRLFELGYEPLSPREMEALSLLADGLSREQIAAQMFVSINTVKGFLRELYRKLGVNSRNAAVVEAETRGLI